MNDECDEMWRKRKALLSRCSEVHTLLQEESPLALMVCALPLQEVTHTGLGGYRAPHVQHREATDMDSRLDI